MKNMNVILISLIGFMWLNAVHAINLPGPVVETSWLEKNQGQVVILSLHKDIKSFTKAPVFKKDKKSGKSKLVKVGGHIPGAKPFPNELLSTKMPAKFLTTADSRQLFNQMGINPSKESITYCNSGHLATGSWFVMSELMGNQDVKMYDGSMHKWTAEKYKVT